MKTLFAIGLTILILSFSTGALAGNPAWSPEKIDQVAQNRCTDAGIGNGSEFTRRGPLKRCNKDSDGSENPDDADRRLEADEDPGNSGEHNANNDK